MSSATWKRGFQGRLYSLVVSKHRNPVAAVGLTSPHFCFVEQRRGIHSSHGSHPLKNQDERSRDRLRATVGHNFPDFIEFWDRTMFRRVGIGLSTASVLAAIFPAAWTGLTNHPVTYVPAALLGTITAAYWHVGQKDIQQTSHALLRNFPVLAHLRYIFETIRPEIRQYFIESDSEGRPFSRLHRAQVYQRGMVSFFSRMLLHNFLETETVALLTLARRFYRCGTWMDGCAAKGVDDTLPFGTRRNVYEVHHEWACHSMWPTQVSDEDAARYRIGTAEFGTSVPYSASVFNISGMSYGAISDNAILALNQGALQGSFYHNTGEGGVSPFHMQGGGDIVWNVGTGYFGCGSGTGEHRVFEPNLMQEVLQEAGGRIKMIEIKLSQGAKPGHGGLLPKAKITKEIAETRKLAFPPLGDCHSPARHSAFGNAHEMVNFISQVRDIAGGIPVGVKMCVGNPSDVASLCKAIVDLATGPDFITVDGAEGGTGAAPPEFSNSVGMPLEEGLVTVRNLLVGAGLRDKVAINASGHICTGFSLLRTLALGANITSAARAFMLSLGCVQALKCNTNKCPTGIATLDKKLMYGLDPTEKSVRVANFHRKTVEAAGAIVGAIGKTNFAAVGASDIMRRVTANDVRTLSEQFPEVESGCLVHGSAPEKLQKMWDHCDSGRADSTKWIY